MPKKKRYAIVDLETTGGMAKRDKITEIGIVVLEGNEVVDKYSTLVNPGRSIPYNITRITGITDDMVADAPKFFEVAKKVVEMTEGAVFVAHNVRFDYSFLKEEFGALGYTFTKRQLCTVRLSRKAFPGLKSYSLGNLIKHFDINVNARHRALDDAAATTIILQKILNQDYGEYTAQDMINAGIKSSRLPKSITMERLHELPETAGVYYFYNTYSKVVYVGKSINIKKRVMQHFSATTQKAERMQKMVHDLSFEETGNELVAMLLESFEIKALKPESCYGACVGEESPADYNSRADLGVDLLKRIFDQNFVLLLDGRSADEKAVVLVEEGHYKGFGYIPMDDVQYGIEELKETIKYVPINPEANGIIRTYLQKHPFTKRITY